MIIVHRIAFERVPHESRLARFYLDYSELIGAVGPGTMLRVREFNHQGTGLHFGALPWFIMGPGIVLLLSASAALALDRGPRRRWSAAPELPMTGARLS